MNTFAYLMSIYVITAVICTAAMSRDIYGIRRQLIGVGSITEVKQSRARLIIGWVTAWDHHLLHTLGHACSDVVSWGSENHVNKMARLTILELDVKEPQWT